MEKHILTKSEDPKIICEKIKKIALKMKPTKKDRLAVEKYLDSKFEGVLMVATDTLAIWRIYESLFPLRDLFLKLSENKCSSIIRYRVSEAISVLVTKRDQDWIIEYFIKLEGMNSRLDFAKVLEKVICPKVEEKLVVVWKLSTIEERKSLIYSTGRVSKRLKQLAAKDENYQVRGSLKNLPGVYAHGKKYT